MADLNVQEVVHGALIIVTLINGKDEAAFVTRLNGITSRPQHVSIADHLKAGKSEKEALNQILAIVKGVVESAHAAKLF